MRIHTLRLECGLRLDAEQTLHQAVTLFVPDAGVDAAVLVCLPGGGMNRRYFDLMAGEDETFSFARQMAARGFIVLTLDHLGVGDSSHPRDSYTLTVERLTAANAEVTTTLLDGLRRGRLLPDLPAMPRLISIGVGHSMGAMLTVTQQALARQHTGLALLGFTTRGLPEFVPAAVRALGDDHAAIRARLPEFARTLFVTDYPLVKASPEGNSLFGSSAADPHAVEAIKRAREGLLPVPAFQSMLPGNVAIEAQQITVPVFLAVGERDMAGTPHRIPENFPACTDLSLQILAGAGHSHFLFASRHALFDRLAHWARGLAQTLPQVDGAQAVAAA